MLTKEDLASIREMMENLASLKEIPLIKADITAMEADIADMKTEIMDMKERMSGMEKTITEIKKTMVTKKEHRALEKRVDALEGRFDNLEKYVHRKFALIENSVEPKISSLYEMTDFYVKQMECRAQREKIEEKLDSIAPLRVIAKTHCEQLSKHEEMLNRLVKGSG
ncbi:MAG: hypothetical protein NC300_05240 [Bacteroidales bacterium]|nr:hypothetical protein [Clostridium sp.]MCM1203528.1 hypothetical protein [Bacteroidales bacterium]